MPRRKQKSMKKFKIFDPLAEAAADPIQSKEDNNDGDPHLVHANTDDSDNLDVLVPCEYCGRTFSASRIKRHAEERTELIYSARINDVSNIFCISRDKDQCNIPY